MGNPLSLGLESGSRVWNYAALPRSATFSTFLAFLVDNARPGDTPTSQMSWELVLGLLSGPRLSLLLRGLILPEGQRGISWGRWVGLLPGRTFFRSMGKAAMPNPAELGDP